VQQALNNHQIYALQPDLQARGINPDNLIDGISLVDYDGFVKLTTDYDKSQSWL
jgi:tRNA 2-thiouridine synthesizing protein B